MESFRSATLRCFRRSTRRTIVLVTRLLLCATTVDGDSVIAPRWQEAAAGFAD